MIDSPLGAGRWGVPVAYPARALQIGAALAGVGAFLFVLTASWALHALAGRSGPVLPPFGIWLLALPFGMTLLHEGTHALVLRWLGYRVACGIAWRLLSCYVIALNQPQSRRDGLLATLAPLVLLTGGLLPGLLADGPVAAAVFVALVFNIVGSVGDLYIAWRLFRMPAGARFCDTGPGTALIQLPVARAGHSA